MAGKFEAPKGGKGFIPKRTNVRPGEEKKNVSPAPAGKPPVQAQKPAAPAGKAPGQAQEIGAQAPSDLRKSQPSVNAGKPQAPVGSSAAPDKTSKAAQAARAAQKAGSTVPASQNAPQLHLASQTPPKKKFPILAILLSVLSVALVAAMIVMGIQIARLMKQTGEPSMQAPTETISIEITAETTEETEPETTEPVPEHVVTTASVAAVGDLLMHEPVINSGRRPDGTFEYSSIFQYLSPTLSKYDYKVANLETTLAGSSKPYHGYPNFNCPDEIVSSAMNAGFNMLLTANNHCFDTGMDGYLRTLEVTKEMGIDTIGTMSSAEDPKYLIRDINGIRFGLICYTYETTNGSGSYPALNGLPMYGGSYDIINTFVPVAPQRMFDEVAGYMEEMKEQGVEATIMFIHWGTENVLSTDKTQPVIAQGLANLGIDVIVGGHPHVVEPMALIQSETDPNHKTVCIYSVGNAVSNQRQGNLTAIQTAHTEDGALFTATFEKYSDGKVYMVSTECIPMWVNMRTQGARAYNILPLDGEKRDSWQAAFDLTEVMMNSCDRSYKRTMDIVGDGLTECQKYLFNQKEARDAYYYDLAWHPEKYENLPEEEPEEAVSDQADEMLPPEGAPIDVTPEATAA